MRVVHRADAERFRLPGALRCGWWRAGIIDNFKNFKGEEAQCFMPADRERLLAVIESAFGDFRFFNKIVRREFAAANERLEQGLNEKYYS